MERWASISLSPRLRSLTQASLEWEREAQSCSHWWEKRVRLGTAQTRGTSSLHWVSAMASWVVVSQQTRTEPLLWKHNHESEPVTLFEGPRDPASDFSTRCSKGKWDRVCSSLSQRRSQMVRPCKTLGFLLRKEKEVETSPRSHRAVAELRLRPHLLLLHPKEHTLGQSFCTWTQRQTPLGRVTRLDVQVHSGLRDEDPRGTKRRTRRIPRAGVCWMHRKVTVDPADGSQTSGLE